MPALAVPIKIMASLASFADAMFSIGWQDLFLLYMFGAMIAGGTKLFRKEPAAWRTGGFILLSIPILLILLMWLN